MNNPKPIKRLTLERETVRTLRISSGIKTGDSLTTPTQPPNGPGGGPGGGGGGHSHSGGGSGSGFPGGGSIPNA